MPVCCVYLPRNKNNRYVRTARVIAHIGISKKKTTNEQIVFLLVSIVAHNKHTPLNNNYDIACFSELFSFGRLFVVHFFFFGFFVGISF